MSINIQDGVISNDWGYNSLLAVQILDMVLVVLHSGYSTLVASAVVDRFPLWGELVLFYVMYHQVGLGCICCINKRHAPTAALLTRVWQFSASRSLSSPPQQNRTIRGGSSSQVTNSFKNNRIEYDTEKPLRSCVDAKRYQFIGCPIVWDKRHQRRLNILKCRVVVVVQAVESYR